MTAPLVLGIETSCDETGIGIVRGHTLLADAVASSVEAHARFGGGVHTISRDAVHSDDRGDDDACRAENSHRPTRQREQQT